MPRVCMAPPALTARPLHARTRAGVRRRARAARARLERALKRDFSRASRASPACASSGILRAAATRTTPCYSTARRHPAPIRGTLRGTESPRRCPTGALSTLALRATREPNPRTHHQPGNQPSRAWAQLPPGCQCSPAARGAKASGPMGQRWRVDGKRGSVAGRARAGCR